MVSLLLLLGACQEEAPPNKSADSAAGQDSATDLPTTESEPPTDDSDPVTDSEPEACGVTLLSSAPPPDSVGVDVGTTFAFTLSAPDVTAMIAAPVAGTQTLADDGVTIVFTPDQPLDFETSYLVSLSWCGGEASQSFTTVSGARDDLVGRSWLVDLTQARIADPAALDALLRANLNIPILLGVESVAPGMIHFIGAPGVMGTDRQHYCSKSLDFGDGTLVGDRVSLTVPQVELPLIGQPYTPTYDFELELRVSEDGETLTEGRIAGTVDLRDLVDQVLPGSTAQQLCDTLAMFGAACAACSDAEPVCLRLEIADIEAEEIPGQSVSVVANDNCPDCRSGPPDPGTCVP